MQFATEALEINHESDGITISCCAESDDVDGSTDTVINSRLLLIANDAGSKKFLTQLGVERTVLHREDISVAVFATKPGDQYGSRPADDIFTSIFVEPGTIFSIATNGETATCASACQDISRLTPMHAWRAARGLGLTSDLCEPPLKISVDIACLNRYADNNWAFIGDSAVAGNPRYGLGAQGGVLWAQALARHITRVDAASLRHGLIGVNTFAEDLARRRCSFELACQKVLDLYAEYGKSLLERLLSVTSMGRLHSLDYHVEQQAGELVVQFAVACDFSALEDETPVAVVLKEVGSLDIGGRLQIRPRGDFWIATLGEADFLSLKMGPIELRLCEGIFSVQRRRHSWRMNISQGVAINRGAPEDTATTAQTLRFSSLEFTFADDLFKSMTAAFMRDIRSLRGAQIPELSLEMTFADGQSMTMGALNLVSSGGAQVCYQLSCDSAGYPQLRLQICKGALPLHSLTAWSQGGLHSFAPEIAQPLRNFSMATLNVFDGLVDQLAAVGSMWLQGMTLSFRPDGGARVYLDLGFPVNFHLNPDDANEMVIDVLKINALGELGPVLRQNLMALVGVQAGLGSSVR